jgi:hypothetical protein
MRLENNGVTSNSQSSPVPGVGNNNGLASNGATASMLKSAASETHSNGTSAVRNGTGKLDVGGLAAAEYGLAPPKSDYFGHDREEVTRILIQALVDLGYRKAATTLEDESEYTLESPYVSSFRHAVLKGDWNNAERLLEGMEIHQDADINVSFSCCTRMEQEEAYEVVIGANFMEGIAFLPTATKVPGAFGD